MKLTNLFKKSFYIKFALVSFLLSFIFFLFALGSLSSTSYRLSNYSGELKKLYNLDSETLLDFGYWFASGDSYDHNLIYLNETPVNTIDIKAPNTNILIVDSYDLDTISYDYNVRKLNSLYHINTIDYKYFNNTKTAKIIINDSFSGVFSPELRIVVPENFKGKIKINAFKDNVNISTDTDIKIDIVQPTEKK
ncbi:MAG: hypothetical protein ACRDDY_17960 [Clostridium sp.]|uniref:hypothetical protein n=1 Tax=Clostridium sp. TaxID=1506 RepID=UPI003EE61A32